MSPEREKPVKKMLLWAVATLAGLALVLVAGFYALLWWAYRDSEYVPTKASESATCALLSLQELEDEVGGTASFVDDVGGAISADIGSPDRILAMTRGFGHTPTRCGTALRTSA